jgi:hypothetical protein
MSNDQPLAANDPVDAAPPEPAPLEDAIAAPADSHPGPIRISVTISVA